MNLTDDEARERFIQIIVEILQNKLGLKKDDDEKNTDESLASRLSDKSNDNNVVTQKEE